MEIEYRGREGDMDGGKAQREGKEKGIERREKTESRERRGENNYIPTII